MKSFLSRSVGAIAVCLLAGCSSNFVRFNNPFEGDIDRAGQALAERRAAHYAARQSNDGEASSSLFGDEMVPDRKPWWKKNSGRGDREEGEGESSRDVARDDSESRDDGRVVTISEIERLRKDTGTVCYPCNGKGYRLRESSRSGDLVICGTCGGSGRR